MKHTSLTLFTFLALICTACGPTPAHYADLGKTALAKGKYRESYAFYDLADAQSTDGKGYSKELAKVSRALGQQYLDQGNCVDARDAFKRAERQIPPVLVDTQSIYSCLTEKAEAEQGEPDPMLEIGVLRDLLAQGDRRRKIVNRLAVLETEHGGDIAISKLLELDQKEPLNLTERKTLVEALESQQRIVEALEQQERIVNIDRNDVVAQFKLADLSEELGAPERTQIIYEKILESQPSNPAIYLRYAEFQKRQGNFKEAYKLQKQADRLRGTDTSPRQLRSLPKSRR